MAMAALPVMSFSAAVPFPIKPRTAIMICSSASGAAAAAASTPRRGLMITTRPTTSSSAHAFLPLRPTTSPSPLAPVVSEISHEEEAGDVTELVTLYESGSISEEIISVYESGSEEDSEVETPQDAEGFNSSIVMSYQNNPVVENGKPKFAEVKMENGAATPTIKVPGLAKNVHYENPFVKVGNRSCFHLELDEEAARVRVDVPGVKVDGLKLWFEGDLLKIEGVESKKYGAAEKQEAAARVYCLSFKMPEDKLLKKEETVAKLEDGVLNVVIPVIKFEERDDIIHVNVI